MTAQTRADLIVLILDLNAPELHKSRRGRGEATEHSAVDENIVKKTNRPRRVSFLLLISSNPLSLDRGPAALHAHAYTHKCVTEGALSEQSGLSQGTGHTDLC